MREGLCVIPEKVPAARRGRAVGVFIHPKKDGVRGIEQSERAVGFVLSRHHRLGTVGFLRNGSWLFPAAHVVQSNAFSAHRIA